MLSLLLFLFLCAPPILAAVCKDNTPRVCPDGSYSFRDPNQYCNYKACPSCPRGSPLRNCSRDPCESAFCPAYPKAQCNPNLCGGCNTKFFENNKQVNCDECPRGVKRTSCKRSPCAGATCPAYPDATCYSDYCGGCNARWFFRGQEVSCKKSTRVCPDGSPMVNCIRDPCSKPASCPRYPNATCHSDYCGGCNAHWVVNGEEVDCNESSDNECPDGSPMVRCMRDPCDGESCPAYPTATCKPDYCGGCNTRWFEDGFEVSCDLDRGCPEDARICPDGSTVVRDPKNDCRFPDCPSEPVFCTMDAKVCPDGTTVGRDPKNGCQWFPCPESVFCTMDAKICPDGSSVGRDPKNGCKWFPCPEPVFCTMDAKICPDGSSVGRDPNNGCEWFPCPDTVFCTMDAKICPDGSSVGRDPNNGCEFFPCPRPAGCTRDLKICPDGSAVGRDHDNGCEFFPCPGPVGCTRDLKICPDGTGVGRDPDNGCEWFPCPDTVACTDDARMCPDGSWVARDPKNGCEFHPCPTTGGCPDGSSPVNCLVDPCIGASCALHPEAECHADFCGGCNTRWFSDGFEVACELNCELVDCAPANCEGAVIPPGGCCPVCPTDPTVDCSAVQCLVPDCPVPVVTPKGECCPICPSITPSSDCPLSMPASQEPCSPEEIVCTYPTECPPCNGQPGAIINSAAVCHEGKWLGAVAVCAPCGGGGFCTSDVQICPDGSSVGRDPENNCNFFPCPPPAVGCLADVQACPDGSFVARDPDNGCKFFPCPLPVACTADAKICPDGSAVGRDANNNCEFFPCPSARFCPMDVRFCPDGTAVGRDPDLGCAFRPCPTVDCTGVRCPPITCDNFTTVEGECCPKCPGSCPDGSDPVNCLIDPCQGAFCGLHPEAECVADYCGGCNTRWFSGGEEVKCGGGCPDGSAPVNCLVDPCQGATCSLYPDAECYADFCGGCNQRWFNDGVEVTCGADCSTVLCAAVTCDNPITPPGACCPVCLDDDTGKTTTFPLPVRSIPIRPPRDCSTVRCAAPECDDAYVPEGQCCPVCPKRDCSLVRCAAPECEDAYIPKGECCAICPKPTIDCSLVRCAAPECDDAYIPDGQCCPVCPKPIDCSMVLCALPACEDAYVPEGQCCPVCPKPDCSLVRCAAPECDDAYVPEGQCCPICPKPVVDCSLVRCAAPKCDNAYVPDGQCCPVCPDDEPVDCRLVFCPMVFCEDPIVPAGTCCPVCEKPDPRPIDCRFVKIKCPAVDCEDPIMPEDSCCPVCPEPKPIDCSLVKIKCPEVFCDNPIIPTDSCCPVCPSTKPPVRDCSTVRCAAVDCDGAYVPFGQCCPICPADDALVGPSVPSNDVPFNDCALLDIACPAVECEDAYIPEGSCCPVCPFVPLNAVDEWDAEEMTAP